MSSPNPRQADSWPTHRPSTLAWRLQCATPSKQEPLLLIRSGHGLRGKLHGPSRTLFSPTAANYYKAACEDERPPPEERAADPFLLGASSQQQGREEKANRSRGVLLRADALGQQQQQQQQQPGSGSPIPSLPPLRGHSLVLKHTRPFYPADAR